MSEPSAPEHESFDLDALRNASQGRRPWRVIPRRHYADIRILSAMAEWAAAMATVMLGVLTAGLLIACMTALGLGIDWLSPLPAVLLALLAGGLALGELLTGMTPGKFFSGLRVRCANGARADVGRLAIRFAGKYVHVIMIAGGVVLDRLFAQHDVSVHVMRAGLLLVVVHAVSLLICPWTQRRMWYDWLSGTAVFNLSTLHEVRDATVGFEVRMTPVVEAIGRPREPDRHGPA